MNINRNFAASLLIASAAVLPGCNQHKQEAAISPATGQPTTPPAAKTATLAQWQGAVNAVFKKSDLRSDDEGVETFNACFDKESSEACTVKLAGKRDAFRKLQHFSEPSLNETSIKSAAPALRAYIALADCETPTFFINPIYRDSEWMFMNQVAILANGELVLDKKIESTKTDNGARWVLEQANLVLSKEEVAAVRAVPTAEKTIIRITGQKGYITLEKKYTDAFKSGLVKLFAAYDALEHAAGSVGKVSCEAAK